MEEHGLLAKSRHGQYRCRGKKWNPGCEDIYETFEPSFGYSLSLVFRGIQGVSSCQQMVSFCDEDSPAGTAVRGLCPVTCLCDDPASQLLLSAPSSGCPKTCLQTDRYKRRMREFNPNCTDYPAESLRNDPVFQYISEARAWVANRSGWPPPSVLMLQRFGEIMLELGCASIPIARVGGMGIGLAIDLCDEDDDRGFPFKSLRLPCPESCGCTSTVASCPSECPAGHTHPVNHTH